MTDPRKLYKPREICEIYNIVPRTLLNWSYKGKIEFTRTEYGQRRYYLPESTPKSSTKSSTKSKTRLGSRIQRKKEKFKLPPIQESVLRRRSNSIS